MKIICTIFQTLNMTPTTGFGSIPAAYKFIASLLCIAACTAVRHLQDGGGSKLRRSSSFVQTHDQVDVAC